MSTLRVFDRITFNPDIMSGRACIRGMRIPVSVIVGQIAGGAAPEQILADYPDLDPAVLAHELRRPTFPVKDNEGMVQWRSELRRLVTHRDAPASDAGNSSESDDEDDDERLYPAWVWRDYISGTVSLEGDALTLKALSFGRPVRDLPRVADWLIAKGFGDVRYGVQEQNFGDED